ncbi:EndoU domain-containing protein, partial [Streptomyces sp. NPDC006649]|uniref:EndoU domain-containing protein n=1 Tax=Streptomyces sp. NPDC006649 TaxID=3156896 RepID=UPI0033B66AB3
PLDVRERVLRGNPRTGAIGLLAPHGAADRPRPVPTGDRNPNGTYQAGTHPDGSPRTVFPDHWTLEETLYAVQQVYLREQATHRLTPTTSTPGIETGNYHFTGDYQGVRITGTADGTGTITDFAPHHDQTDLETPLHLEPPVLPELPDSLRHLAPQPGVTDAAIGEGTLHFITYGSTHSMTGVHYALPGTNGADVQRDQGVQIHPLWSGHPNGTRWAQVWFKDPNGDARRAQAVANGTTPPHTWRIGGRENGTLLGTDGSTSLGRLLFPERWSTHDLWDAIVVAHRNARSNGSWVEVPEGGYLWEGVYDGVRMHGHVRDGEQLWVRPSSNQPTLRHSSPGVVAVTAPVEFRAPKPDGSTALFRIRRVIHQDGTLGIRVTRVLQHPELPADTLSRLVDHQLPEMEKQLAAQFHLPDQLQRRELSGVTFDVELSPAANTKMKLERRSELFQIMMDNSDTDTLTDLMTVGPADASGLKDLLRGMAEQLPPAPEAVADWRGPQGQPHHEQDRVWASDVTTSVRRARTALLDEPGVRGLLAQHRNQEPPAPDTNTEGNENAGIDADREAAAAAALGLDPTELTSIRLVLQGSAPLRPALDALGQLAARLEAGDAGALVRRMSELGSPISEWWHFSSHLHTQMGLMSDVVSMELAGAQYLLHASRTHPLPAVPRETLLQAHELGVHPRYLTRLADALGVRPQDIANLGRDKSYWQQPLSPEALKQDYRDREREKQVDIRIARDHSRFDTAADELLGSDPTRTEQRFRSFMHWSMDAQHFGLDIFTDQRLRELAGHWREETQDGARPVPADFDPRAKGKRQAELFLTVKLAELSGPLPPKLAEELAEWQAFVQFQLMQLDGRYPPVAPPTEPHTAQPSSNQPHNSPHRAPVSIAAPTPTAIPTPAATADHAAGPTTAPGPEPVTDDSSLGNAEIGPPSDRTREAGGATASVWERAFSVERTLLSDGSVRSDITVRVYLDLQPGTTDNHVANTKDMAKRGIDTYYNDPKHRLPNGDLLHVELEFVDGPARAHHTVQLHPDPDGTSRDDSATWYVSESGEGTEDKSYVIAHETGHLLGFQDQYRETKEGVPLRPVYDDHSLMSGTAIDESGLVQFDMNHALSGDRLSPTLRIMPRDLLLLSTAIDAAWSHIPGAGTGPHDKATAHIPRDVRERVLRGNPRTGTTGLLAPRGPSGRARPEATG